MEKIRILHLIHQLGSGGAENGIINLLNRINNNLFSSALCAFKGKGEQTCRLDRESINLFELDKRSGNDITIPVKLIKVFKKWKPHIVHTHAWGTLCEGIIATKLARVPIIVHGEHGTIQRKPANIVAQRIFWNLADKILSVSHEHSKRLSECIGFSLDKIKVIANGVDTNRFRPKNNGENLREALNLSRDDVVIGTVGRLVHVKNQALLTKAFSLLIQRYSNVKLILVGDGPLMNSLQSQANVLGCSTKIMFLGRRSDIPEIMASLDIFALTSHSEGMSNTILEAMSSGLPVVATEVGGNIELLDKDVTGVLVPPDDVEALVDALSYLVEHSDIRKKMGQSGRKRAQKSFSLQTMVHNYEKLYIKWYEKKVIRYSG